LSDLVIIFLGYEYSGCWQADPVPDLETSAGQSNTLKFAKKTWRERPDLP
jgi:hypothetical protein